VRFNSALPGPAPFDGSSWYLLLRDLTADNVSLQLWQQIDLAAEEETTSVAPTSISLRLSTSKDGLEWVHLVDEVASGAKLALDSKGYRIVTLKVPSEHLKNAQPARLWSRRYRLSIAFFRHIEVPDSLLQLNSPTSALLIAPDRT
jgi:hypothetical protein